MKRIQKINLLTALIAGKATLKQVADLRQSMEPIQLTFVLGDEGNPFEQDTDEPTYCIDVYTDGTVKCYDRYLNRKIEYRKNA